MGIEVQIKEFISQNFRFGDSEDEFRNDQSLLDSGIIDSTGVLELVSFVEDNFNIHLEDEEIIPENIDSVENLAKFIQKKKGEPAIA